MFKGDYVVAVHPDSRSNKLIRSYGIVQEITETGVIIKMADGSLIKRQFNSIAVYVQPPSNWQDLYEEQEIEFFQSKHPMMSRGSYSKQLHN
jgi:hypothetical protein